MSALINMRGVELSSKQNYTRLPFYGQRHGLKEITWIPWVRSLV